MMRAFRKLAAVFTSLAAALMFVQAASAAAPNGIGVSASDVRPGDTFTVTLSVPSAEKADTASVRTEFDGSAFEVVSWSPTMANSVSNSGDGFFAVTSANATRTIDLTGGLSMKAEMRVKTGAASGKYKIKLVKNSISYVEDNGYDYVELWKPDVTEVTVNVSGGTSAKDDKSDDQGSSGEKQGAEDDGDTSQGSGGNKDSTADGDVPADKDEESSGKKDEESSGKKNDEPAASGESTGSKAKITFDNELDELGEGKVNIATKAGFFSGDATIRITRPPESQEAGAIALENLGLAGHGFYAFDISIYDNASGKKIVSLPDGYVKITMPIPRKFAGATDGLVVYHTESGFPQRMSSEITEENGQLRIVFKLNSFSPYMIVDTLNKSVTPSQSASGGAAANSDSGREAVIVDAKDTKNHGKPLNPDTGVAAAVVIPSAVACCVILARKQGHKRRRAKRKDPED